jgi:ferredoxin, 2Fe-2S
MLLRVTDREGTDHDVNASASGSLMELLRGFEWGVTAICGGSCACGTCHVYVAPGWSERLPAPHSDERELLTDLQEHRDTSRLSCRILLAPGLDGLCVTLAPEE